MAGRTDRRCFVSDSRACLYPTRCSCCATAVQLATSLSPHCCLRTGRQRQQTRPATMSLIWAAAMTIAKIIPTASRSRSSKATTATTTCEAMAETPRTVRLVGGSCVCCRTCDEQTRTQMQPESQRGRRRAPSTSSFCAAAAAAAAAVRRQWRRELVKAAAGAAAAAAGEWGSDIG